MLSGDHERLRVAGRVGGDQRNFDRCRDRRAAAVGEEGAAFSAGVSLARVQLGWRLEFWCIGNALDAPSGSELKVARSVRIMPVLAAGPLAGKLPDDVEVPN